MPTMQTELQVTRQAWVGQSIARKTSSHRDVSTSGDVVQIDHCTTPGLRCNQAGGSGRTPLGTKRKSNPQDRWRTIRMESGCGSLVSWIGQNTVPFRNCTQPNRTGNISPQADVQGTSPRQALDLELGQHRRSHTGIQTEPCSTGSLWPETRTNPCGTRSRARRPNHFYPHRGARHSTKRQGQRQGQEQGKPWKPPPWEKTKPPWAWTHWETAIWERSHAANADARLEIHRRGGG